MFRRRVLALLEFFENLQVKTGCNRWDEGKWEGVLFLVCSLLQTGGEDGEWRAGQTAGFLVF